MPDAWSDLENITPEDCTTEFILQYSQYDRGNMYKMHGMSFEYLKKLDPERLKAVIPAMCGSKDEQLSLVGYRAIERMKGVTFVDLILNDMIERDRRWNWAYLRDDKDPKVTDERLRALVAACRKNYTHWGQASFWLEMSESRCGEPAIIEEAIASLGEVEKLKNQPKKGQEQESEEVAKMLEQNLRAYLDKAKEFRVKPATQPASSVEQYKEFFRDHPPQKDQE